MTVARSRASAANLSYLSSTKQDDAEETTLIVLLLLPVLQTQFAVTTSQRQICAHGGARTNEVVNDRVILHFGKDSARRRAVVDMIAAAAEPQAIVEFTQCGCTAGGASVVPTQQTSIVSVSNVLCIGLCRHGSTGRESAYVEI